MSSARALHRTRLVTCPSQRRASEKACWSGRDREVTSVGRPKSPPQLPHSFVNRGRIPRSLRQEGVELPPHNLHHEGVEGPHNLLAQGVPHNLHNLLEEVGLHNLLLPVALHLRVRASNGAESRDRGEEGLLGEATAIHRRCLQREERPHPLFQYQSGSCWTPAPSTRRIDELPSPARG